MNKGERTRQAILKQSIIYSSQFGLADITIGTVSKLCNLSRTGVISHFKNKEDMQIAILQFGEDLFNQQVIKNAWRENPLEHLKAILNNWANWTNEIFTEYHVNCPFIKAIIEFQNRPASKVRTFTIDQQDRLLNYLTHRITRCIEADLITSKVDASTIALELYSLYLGHVFTQHSHVKTANKTDFCQSIERLLERYK